MQAPSYTLTMALAEIVYWTSTLVACVLTLCILRGTGAASAGTLAVVLQLCAVGLASIHPIIGRAKTDDVPADQRLRYPWVLLSAMLVALGVHGCVS